MFHLSNPTPISARKVVLSIITWSDTYDSTRAWWSTKNFRWRQPATPSKCSFCYALSSDSCMVDGVASACWLEKVRETVRKIMDSKYPRAPLYVIISGWSNQWLYGELSWLMRVHHHHFIIHQNPNSSKTQRKASLFIHNGKSAALAGLTALPPSSASCDGRSLLIGFDCFLAGSGSL